MKPSSAPTVLAELTIERNHFFKLQAFHDDEAQSVAIGEALVRVGAQDRDGVVFVFCLDAFDLTEALAYGLQKGEGHRCAAANPVDEQRMGFIEDRVGRIEIPPLLESLREDDLCRLVIRVFCDQVSKEATGIHEDAFHEYTSPKCSYLSPETSSCSLSALPAMETKRPRSQQACQSSRARRRRAQVLVLLADGAQAPEVFGGEFIWRRGVELVEQQKRPATAQLRADAGRTGRQCFFPGRSRIYSGVRTENRLS